jgi:hypothetical protein
MPESTLDNQGTVPRRAIVAAPLVGILTFATMIVVANVLDLPVNDPDGAILGSPLILIAVVMAVLIALDVIPRAIYRTRTELGRAAAGVRDVFRERWTPKRLAIVTAALLGFYLTYVGYRNLKSFLPFATDANHDTSLLQLDRDMAFGNDPGTLLHDLLGTGASAHVLSVVYLFFLLFVPLSLGVAVVWQRRLHGGLWYVTSMNVAWVLGTISYYALPALGPIFVEPQIYAALPDTGVSALQEALVEHRGEVLASPHGAEGVQSIAAFASLHVAIVLVAAIIATLMSVRRFIQVSLWVFFALTVVATIYFGWHYIIDDVAGVVIAVAAVLIGAAATGHSLRPAGSRQLSSFVDGGVGRLVGGSAAEPQAAVIGARVIPRDKTAERHSE